MRCQGCNRNLSDYESTRKDKKTGGYLDLCSKCHKETKEDIAEALGELQPADGEEEDYD